MLQFTYKLTVRERVKAKCPRHPWYNPETQGQGGIVAGCSTCSDLYDLLDARKSSMPLRVSSRGVLALGFRRKRFDWHIRIFDGCPQADQRSL
jgi:hypothetical protein